MRIDAHQHFWKFDAARDNWMTKEMAVIQRDFFPDDLEITLKQNGFDGTVLVQVQQTLEENSWMLELAREKSFIKGVVGWIDFKSPQLESLLEELSGVDLLKGFRHIVQSEKDPEFLLQPDFISGVRLLKRFGFTYDILIYNQQLPMAVRFVQSLPDQPLVLDHIAKPDIKSGNWKTWAEGIRQLASFPNIFCKISGMVTEANWKNWKPEHFKIYLDVVTEAFGPGRMMYGSDWPVCTLAGTYEQQYRLVSDYFSSFSEDEKSALFGLNAIRFYKL